MNPFNVRLFRSRSMSVGEFNTLSSFIFSNYGIKLPLTKKTMLEGRLHKRLSILKMNSFKEYCDYVFSIEGQRTELMHMIDVVTTNKTDFFRENAHFEFLISDVITKNFGNFSAIKPYKVWSAGCSSGEEPYTLSMVLQEFKSRYPSFDYDIMGTDISSRALQDAMTAIYTEEKAAPIPMPFKKKYLLKSRDPKNKTVRIIPN
jgi:chemotaxis protein methyltransferase CheR